jgi:hypothetical protein
MTMELLISLIVIIRIDDYFENPAKTNPFPTGSFCYAILRGWFPLPLGSGIITDASFYFTIQPFNHLWLSGNENRPCEPKGDS